MRFALRTTIASAGPFIGPFIGLVTGVLMGLLAMSVTLLGTPSIAAAQEDVAIEGEILDMTCYLHKGSKGRRHRACAAMCAEKGLPIGVLTDNGEVYLLIEDHDNPEPYGDAVKLAGKKAAISGKKYSKAGISAIMVMEAKNP